jgi:hypothetical protein
MWMMIQREVDPGALVEHVSRSSDRSSGASMLPAGPTEEEQEELLDYSPVPPRKTQMVLVPFRPGARLKPLPYSLDDENP